MFLTSNAEKQYAGSDFLGGGNSVTGAIAALFRPSDVAVGPDGALYVSDWIDARVGGHQDLDDTLAGAIYRIAPKGFVSKVPAFDAATVEGLITALRSPAVNVRAIGFAGLTARGSAVVDAVAGLLDDPSPYLRGRAIFLLYQLGPEGRERAAAPESHRDPALRIAAYRAMRRAGQDVMPVALRLARDPDAGVRREVALSMRDQADARGLDVLVDIAHGFDGQDRSYLEALGTGATGKEPRLYDRLRLELRVSAMLDLAGRGSALREPATWWLLNRLSNEWADHQLLPALKARGIYDPASIVLREHEVGAVLRGEAEC